MPKSQTIPCTKEEINRLIETSMENEFYFTLFMVAKTTGRRLGELYAIKVKDFYPDKNILITQVLKRKRYVEKEAIINNEVSRILNLYIIKNKLKLDDYIFHKVSYRQIQKKIKVYSKKAGILHNVTFHNFRHYFITELVRMGWSYDKISKLTGHSSVGTLAVYDHSVASDIKDDALKALENI